MRALEEGPTNPESCHCSRPLHYSNPNVQVLVEELIRLKGPYLRVSLGERTWLVQRHFLALHGLKAQELPSLGFREVTVSEDA